MQVVLEVTTGPDAGRKVRLGAGQGLQVGRTEWADLALTQDGRMADVHFSLECDYRACYIQDLSGGKGTLLNGQQLARRTALCNGDNVQAGDTVFAVRIESDTAAVAPAASPQAASARAAPLVPPLAPAAKRPGKVTYTLETCDTGLTLCRGNVDEIEPHELAVALARTVTPYLIVDFKKLESGKPENLDSPDYLFNWLEPTAAAVFSPVVLSPQELATWPALIEKGWGEDAVICLFSRQEKPPLLAHLRATCRGRPDPHGRGSAIIGYCWPSVMAPLLANYTADFVNHLLRGIDAVLVELPDLPVTWQVYGNGRLAGMLDALGFVRAEAEKLESEESEDES